MKAKLQNKINLKDYSGDAYIGIDVHRKSYSVAIIVERIVVKKLRLPADGLKLLAFLRKILPKAKLHSVYEAGFSGYPLHRILSTAKINNIIVNPASIQVASASRVKTDKLDAIKLAEHLSLGLLKGIRIRTVAEEEQRLLSRNRAQLVRDRVRMMARSRMRLIQFDLLPVSFDKVLTLRQVKNLLNNKSVSQSFKLGMSHLINVWEQIESELKLINYKYQARQKEDPLVTQYMKVPGIGLKTGIVLADELLDCSQFKSEKALFSFIGFTPSEHSSGETVRKGRITRQGNPQLRFMLIQSAWVAIRCDPALRSFYGRVAARRGANKAIVAVARKLVGRARAVIKNKANYELNYNKTNTLQLAA